MWVAVDVMSGDHGPSEIIEGAVESVNKDNNRVVLVGREDLISEHLMKYDYDTSFLKIEHAHDVIEMTDSPTSSVRTSPESSVVRAMKLVAAKECVGMFSPGNTGATMTAALIHLGRIPGVKRPPIAAPIPRENKPPLLLLDAGANVDCKPEYLVQFAVIGSIFYQSTFGVENPKIGILANGEEDNKGCEITLSLFEILKKLPLNFVGNVEGRDLYGNGKDVDVVVCDGFTGNIVIKATEGLALSIFESLKSAMRNSGIAKTGAFLLKSALTSVKKRLDYSEYGGAVLLGVDGIVVIGHGSSNATATRNAIRLVSENARNRINERILEMFETYRI